MPLCFLFLSCFVLSTFLAWSLRRREVLRWWYLCIFAIMHSLSLLNLSTHISVTLHKLWKFSLYLGEFSAPDLENSVHLILLRILLLLNTVRSEKLARWCDIRTSWLICMILGISCLFDLWFFFFKNKDEWKFTRIPKFVVERYSSRFVLLCNFLLVSGSFGALHGKFSWQICADLRPSWLNLMNGRKACVHANVLHFDPCSLAVQYLSDSLKYVNHAEWMRAYNQSLVYAVRSVKSRDPQRYSLLRH